MSPPSRSEGMVMRIETTRVVPSQAEVVMSDGESLFLLRTNLLVVKLHKQTIQNLQNFLLAFNVNYVAELLLLSVFE
jgi:hypothetical protein